MDFEQDVVEESSYVVMTCSWYEIQDPMSITWYRLRPSGNKQLLWIVSYRNSNSDSFNVSYRDTRPDFLIGRPAEGFESKIVHEPTAEFNTSHSIKLLDVDSNDISTYWCEASGDKDSVWINKTLKVEGKSLF